MDRPLLDPDVRKRGPFEENVFFPDEHEPAWKRFKTVGQLSFCSLPPHLQIGVFSHLSPAEILGVATVCRDWSKLNYLSLHRHCVVYYRLAWAPYLQRDLLRMYEDSNPLRQWVRVCKVKKRMMEVFEEVNSQQPAGHQGWSLENHSMPFCQVQYQSVWNDAFHLIWAESFNYTVIRKRLPSDTLTDMCDLCHLENENDLILCDSCPRMFHLPCLGLKRLPEGSYFCSNCANPKNPSGVKDAWFSAYFVRQIKEVADTTYHSGEEDYQSSGGEELDEIDEEPLPEPPEEPSDDDDFDSDEIDRGSVEDDFSNVEEDEGEWLPKKKRQEMSSMQNNLYGAHYPGGPIAPGSVYAQRSFPANTFGMQQPQQRMNVPQNSLSRVPQGFPGGGVPPQGFRPNYQQSYDASGGGYSSSGTVLVSGSYGQTGHPQSMQGQSQPFQSTQQSGYPQNYSQQASGGSGFPMQGGVNQVPVQLGAGQILQPNQQLQSGQIQPSQLGMQNQMLTASLMQRTGQGGTMLTPNQMLTPTGQGPQQLSGMSGQGSITGQGSQMHQGMQNGQGLSQLNPMLSNSIRTAPMQTSSMQGSGPQMGQSSSQMIPPSHLQGSQLSSHMSSEGNGHLQSGGSIQAGSMQAGGSMQPGSMQQTGGLMQQSGGSMTGSMQLGGSLQTGSLMQSAGTMQQSGQMHSQLQTGHPQGSQMHPGSLGGQSGSGQMQTGSMQGGQMQGTQMRPSQIYGGGTGGSMPQSSQFFGSFQQYDPGYVRSGESFNPNMGSGPSHMLKTQAMYNPSNQSGYTLPSSKPQSLNQRSLNDFSGPSSRRSLQRRTVVTRSKDQKNSQNKAACFPFSREGKQNAVKKFDSSQIAEVLFVSYGVPLEHEELIELDEYPDAQPKANTPELKRVFEIVFRFWNSQYGRLAYFPRAPFDNNCGALWIGKTLESVAYADVTDAHIPSAAFISAKYPKPPKTETSAGLNSELKNEQHPLTNVPF